MTTIDRLVTFPRTGRLSILWVTGLAILLAGWTMLWYFNAAIQLFGAENPFDWKIFVSIGGWMVAYLGCSIGIICTGAAIVRSAYALFTKSVQFIIAPTKQ